MPSTDNFIPASAIEQCRIELKQMENHYTPGRTGAWFYLAWWESMINPPSLPLYPKGQIWVGKEADAGAQIAVQDVRGDVVLWLDEQVWGGMLHLCRQ